MYLCLSLSLYIYIYRHMYIHVVNGAAETRRGVRCTLSHGVMYWRLRTVCLMIPVSVKKLSSGEEYT